MQGDKQGSPPRSSACLTLRDLGDALVHSGIGGAVGMACVQPRPGLELNQHGKQALVASMRQL